MILWKSKWIQRSKNGFQELRAMRSRIQPHPNLSSSGKGIIPEPWAALGGEMIPPGLGRAALAQLTPNHPSQFPNKVWSRVPKLLKVASPNGKGPKVTIKPLSEGKLKISIPKGSDFKKTKWVRKQKQKVPLRKLRLSTAMWGGMAKPHLTN